jgi:hypothetical protein
MPQATSEISLGDLAWALKKLKPTNETTRLAIAQTLGMSWLPPQKREVVSKRKRRRDTETAVVPRSQPIFERPTAENRVLSSRLEHTRNEKPAPSIYVPPLEASAPESEAQPLLLEPLFFPRWTRGILSSGLATNSANGTVDVDRVVKLLANGEAVEELPLLSSPTLTRGVQLLIDRSQAMMPFIRDQVRLHEEILAVVGPDRVETLRFVGCPTRGAGAGPEHTWAQYAPPLTGAPVLLLTDLGIGRPGFGYEHAGVNEWVMFAHLVRKAKSPLIAFVPYDESRWPTLLRNHISIIQWDRNTTAITISNKLKWMREVGR